MVSIMYVDSLPVLAGMALSVGGFFLWLLYALMQPEPDSAPECANPDDCQLKNQDDCADGKDK